MGITAKLKSQDLAALQLKLMKGLIARGLRITSSGGDGASVERECQRITAQSAILVEHIIKHPDPELNMIPITVSMYNLDNNIYTIIQDSKHGLKTFRNNMFSGARCLTLGNFLVFYQQAHGLALDPQSPLYRRDVIKYDKQDDNAATRLFSADTLELASKNPTDNMGLVVYLLVFGDFILIAIRVEP